MWSRCKPTYHAAAKKATLKKKSAKVKDQFGDPHSATPLPASVTSVSDPEGTTPMGLVALDGCFDNLAVAATNEKSVLEELVINLTTLTTSNREMADTIKKIMGKNQQLHQQLNNFQNRVVLGDANRRWDETKKCAPTASNKSGTSRTNALNWPRMRRAIGVDDEIVAVRVSEQCSQTNY